MKTTAFAAAALLASLVTVAAHAQTGTPSAQEVGTTTAAAPSAPVDVAEADVGSYARYLMLNGKTREEAVKEAQTFDHPAPVRRFAWNVKARSAATTTQQ
jgi:hypothetical protein